MRPSESAVPPSRTDRTSFWLHTAGGREFRRLEGSEETEVAVVGGGIVGARGRRGVAVAWAALFAWVATALGGTGLFLQWLRHGGLSQREGIRAPRLLTHAGLAGLGLALWIGFLVSDESILAWVAIAVLLAVAVLGTTMFAIWLRGRNKRDHTTVPAETSFPVPVVFGHGALGALTLVLAVLAASGVGN